MNEVLSLILGGGRGTRLYPLTKQRSEPAVPIAGKYRLIDIPISNCLNSGVNWVYVVTQFQSASVHRHIANTYKFTPFSRAFVEVLAAQQTNEGADWYRGTADAVRQNLRYVETVTCRDVLVLSSDQLYRMDYRKLVDVHREQEADITIAVMPVARREVSGFGILRLDASNHVTRMVEKPESDDDLVALRTPAEDLRRLGLSDPDRDYLANMGIYLFRRAALLDLLAGQPQAVDFVREIFPRCLSSHRVGAYLFDGYWEDLGTIRTYHEANLALASDEPPFDFYVPEGVIYTRPRYLPASRVSAATVEHCLISDGCFVAPGAVLERCVLGVRSCVGRNVTLRDTLLLGADRHETDAERADNERHGVPDLGVGPDCLVEGAIIDKDCRIGRGVRIINRRRLQNDEGDNYVIRDGIVVIPNGAVVPDGTEI